MGGGAGHRAAKFRSMYPNLAGRVVVQDLAKTLEHMKPIEGVDLVEHDFFQPQPIQGAKFYHLRHVMHDWSEDDCVKILSMIVPAMDADSRVLIDDAVLPDTGTPWQASFMDVTMLMLLGGAERTRAEMERLLDRAGLRIVDLYVFNKAVGQSIIAAALK